jgi:hypothetical protein
MSAHISLLPLVRGEGEDEGLQKTISYMLFSGPLTPALSPRRGEREIFELRHSLQRGGLTPPFCKREVRRDLLGLFAKKGED